MIYKRRFYALNRWLFRRALNGLGFDNWRSLEASGEAWVVRNVLGRVFGPAQVKPVCLDVGAHTGEYAELLLSQFPQACVHAFEPHPVTHELLRKAVGMRVGCHPLALGAEAGEFELFDRKKCDGSVRASLSRVALESVQQEELVAHRVQVSTVDCFLAEQGIERVDLLKIDTEGFEMDVLIGAAQALQEGRVRVIQFEFNQLHIGRRQFLADFMARLPGHRLYRILPDGLISLAKLHPFEREIFAFQNILAVPAETPDLWP